MNDQAERNLALYAKEGKYLVSAGAGSGKTYTLTHRIVELVKEGVSLQNLLVLTFTNKAAAEMKGRTRELLNQDPALRRYLPDLEASDICTFDSFAARLVKQYHKELGLPKDVANLDETILEVVERRFLNEVFEERYAQEISLHQGEKIAFAQPITPFAKFLFFRDGKNDDNLQSFVFSIYHLSERQEDPEAWLDSLVEFTYSPEQIDACIEEFREEFVRRIRSSRDRVLSYFTSEDLSNPEKKACYDKLRSYYESAGVEGNPSLEELSAWASGPSPRLRFGKNVSDEWKDGLKKVREAAKSNYWDAWAKGVGSEEEIRASILSTKEEGEMAVSLAKELKAKLDHYKEENAAYSFSDIAALAAKAARIDSVRASLRERYRYIMVDEYQDTSALQEEFLNSLGAENVYQVGDMKQSIYRFRDATPELFQQKLRQYEAPTEEELRYAEAKALRDDPKAPSKPSEGEIEALRLAAERVRKEAEARGRKGVLLTLSRNFRSREPVLGSVNLIYRDAMGNKELEAGTSYGGDDPLGGVRYKEEGHDLAFGQTAYREGKGEGDHRTLLLHYTLPALTSRGEYEAALIAEDVLEKMKSAQVMGKGKGKRPARYSDFAILLDARTDLDRFRRIFSERNIPLEAESGKGGEVPEAAHALVLLSEFAVMLSKENPEANPRFRHVYIALARGFLFGESDEAIARALKGGSYREEGWVKRIKANLPSLVEGPLPDALSFFVSEFSFASRLVPLGSVKKNYAYLQAYLRLAEGMSHLGWRLPEFVSFFRDAERFGVSVEAEVSEEPSDAVRLMTMHASKGLEFPFVYLPGLTHRLFKSARGEARCSVSAKYGIGLSPLDEEGVPHGSLLTQLNQTRERLLDRSERLRLLYVAMTRAKESLILLIPDEEESGAYDPRRVLLKQPLYSPGVAARYLDFLSFTDLDPAYFRSEQRETDLKHPLLAPASPSVGSGGIPAPRWEGGKAAIEPEIPSSRRASKASSFEKNEAALAYGTRLHRLMEVADLSDKSASWVEDPAEREKIAKVLSLPLFDGLSRAKRAFREYHYQDERGVEGSIDLLILYEDRVDIIDYKSFSIDDEAYVGQLNAYAEEVAKLFPGLPIHKFLISLRQGAYREVK